MLVDAATIMREIERSIQDNKVADHDVLEAFGLYGSVVFDEHVDSWSDIDVLLISRRIDVDDLRTVRNIARDIRSKVETMYQSKAGITVFSVQQYANTNEFERLLQLHGGQFAYEERGKFGSIYEETISTGKDGKYVARKATNFFCDKLFGLMKDISSSSLNYPVGSNIHHRFEDGHENNSSLKIRLAAAVDYFFLIAQALVIAKNERLILSKQESISELAKLAVSNSDMLSAREIVKMWRSWSEIDNRLAKMKQCEKDALYDMTVNAGLNLSRYL